MSQQIYRLPELMRVIGLKKTAIDRMVDQGDFPRPIRLGPKSKGWLVDEVTGWLDVRKAERDASARPEKPCLREAAL